MNPQETVLLKGPFSWRCARPAAICLHQTPSSAGCAGNSHLKGRGAAGILHWFQHRDIIDFGMGFQ